MPTVKNTALNYRRYTSFCLLLIISITSGCVTQGIDRKINSQDSASIVNHMEQNNLSFSALELNRVLPVCEAYFKVKRYKQFDACLDHYESREKNRWVWFDGSFGTTFNQSGKDAVFHVWKAQVALDLSDDTAAKNHAERATQLFDGGNVKPIELMAVFNVVSGFTLDNHHKSWLYSRYQVAALGVLIISQARLGDTAAAHKNIQKLENIDTLGATEKFKDPQNLWLAKSYIAVGEYQKAILAANQSLSLSLSDIGSGAANLLGAPINYSVAQARGTGYGSFESRWAYQSESQLTAIKCHALFKLGQDVAAENCYNDPKTKTIIESFGDLAFLRLKNLGEIKYQRHDLEGAYQYFQQAIDSLEQQRATTATDTAKIGVISNRTDVYNSMIAVLIQSNNIEEAFEYVERAKSRALVDMLASKQQFGSQQNTQTAGFIDELNELSLNNSTLNNTRSVRGLKRKVKSQAPKLSSVTTVTAKKYNELTAYISKDEVLVEYFGANDLWYAFVIANSKLSVFELPAQDLEERVSNFRKEILTPNTNNYKKYAKSLYDILIRPIKPALIDKNLTIVAHGALHYLPFNTLYDGNEFLIDQYSLRFLPSTSVLAYIDNHQQEHQPLNLLAIGNPDLNNPSFDLPAAQKEAEALGKTIPDARIFIGKQATETALKSNSSSARHLHIASHGQFDPQQPLSSRLLLAADDENDGILTVSDIYNLNLKADLVTLSACETGLGDVKKGDDVIGLTRGFLYAGASSIVSSLWVVDDDATEKLMVNFYSHIDQLGKRKALRAAQLEIKNNHRAHPFYWAAFQLTGLE